MTNFITFLRDLLLNNISAMTETKQKPQNKINSHEYPPAPLDC